jgi:hypothetical protein
LRFRLATCESKEKKKEEEEEEEKERELAVLYGSLRKNKVDK